MKYDERWDIIASLGGGGQGVVHRVRPKTSGRLGEKQLATAIFELANHKSISDDHRELQIENISKFLPAILQRDDPSLHGALKLLHRGDRARDAELAEERIRLEIEALQALSHPNIAKIIDSDSDEQWFVTKYYEKGSLDEHSRFRGNVAASLIAIRPVVEAAAYFHNKGVIHRDIKPNNIFVDQDGSLILGDFGLVFFEDADRSRISETYENVGSRDWEPPWAFGVRIEELRPSFDVFSLAKVIWSMIAGLPVLQLWYFDDERFDIKQRYPEREHISLMDSLFSRCIVEREEHCLPDASALLEEVDEVLRMIRVDSTPSNLNSFQPCRVCGVGRYENLITWETNPSKYSDFGLRPHSERKFNIYTCDNCGHVQLFSYYGDVPPAWK